MEVVALQMILASVVHVNLELFKEKRKYCNQIPGKHQYLNCWQAKEEEAREPNAQGARVRAREECCLVCLEKIFFQGGAQMFVVLLK